MSKKKDEKQGELGFEIVSFSGDSDLGPVENLTLDPDRDTIWASTEQMSKLFLLIPESHPAMRSSVWDGLGSCGAMNEARDHGVWSCSAGCKAKLAR